MQNTTAAQVTAQQYQGQGSGTAGTHLQGQQQQGQVALAEFFDAEQQE